MSNLKHICEINFKSKYSVYWSEMMKELSTEDSRVEMLNDDLRKLINSGCGKCIVEMFLGIIDSAPNKETKLEYYQWLHDLVYGEEALKDEFYSLLDRENWDGVNPFNWLNNNLDTQQEEIDTILSIGFEKDFPIKRLYNQLIEKKLIDGVSLVDFGKHFFVGNVSESSKYLNKTSIVPIIWNENQKLLVYLLSPLRRSLNSETNNIIWKLISLHFVSKEQKKYKPHTLRTYATEILNIPDKKPQGHQIIDELLSEINL